MLEESLTTKEEEGRKEEINLKSKLIITHTNYPNPNPLNVHTDMCVMLTNCKKCSLNVQNIFAL